MDKKTKRYAKLVLEDGSEFSGWAFGKKLPAAGEIVFNTGMNGLAQVLTDPSCQRQIVVSTYPLAGNTGIPVKKDGKPYYDEYRLPLSLESEHIQAAGLVVSDFCEKPNHHSSGINLSAWLEKENIPGIYGIDTRVLAIRLRERGTMKGKILIEGRSQITMDYGSLLKTFDGFQAESKIYTPKQDSTEYRLKIALIDCGVKANVIRSLLSRNVQVIRINHAADIQKFDFDGIIISSGPGDPKDYQSLTEKIRYIFTLDKPILGIGLGNLLIALACGADTHKLPFGHRGQNQPCILNGTNRCYVTTQNHGFTIREGSLPNGWEPWFINANDGSIEGIKCENIIYRGVMFYPEGCPGSQDTSFIFDDFIRQVKETKR